MSDSDSGLRSGWEEREQGGKNRGRGGSRKRGAVKKPRKGFGMGVIATDRRRGK